MVYLGGIINSIGDVTTDVNRGIDKALKCFVKYGRPIYDHSYIALAENVRFLRAEVIKIIPQGCVIQTACCAKLPEGYC